MVCLNRLYPIGTKAFTIQLGKFLYGAVMQFAVEATKFTVLRDHVVEQCLEVGHVERIGCFRRREATDFKALDNIHEAHCFATPGALPVGHPFGYRDHCSRHDPKKPLGKFRTEPPVGQSAPLSVLRAPAFASSYFDLTLWYWPSLECRRDCNSEGMV